jgi:putative PIN family toxin of toxin-antitoxin system
MRLVLDTNVVASALLWDGAPRQLLRWGFGKDVRLLTSTPLLQELTEILSRPKFAMKIQASQLSVDQLVDLYAAVVAVVTPVPLPRIAPDPDDDVVIATALAAKADFVVTGDRTLLSVRKYEGVQIISVNEAIEAIAEGGSTRTVEP